jgi:hypothetical protein
MPARIPKEVCLAELRRVAELLGRKAFTVATFDAHATVSSQAVRMRCGGWDRALHEAGLSAPPRIGGKPVPFATLARALAQATVALGRLPTLTEVARHADRHPQTFSKRWSGYAGFKRAALAHLLGSAAPLPVGPEVRELLEAEQRALQGGTAGKRRRGRGPQAGRRRPMLRPPPALRHRLDFRGFAYAPTCEQGVVQLFGAVARDLGFQILHTRSAFPDCVAIRNKIMWRIEFEYTSRDFRRHRHAPEGCDLIVCWRHDWPDCPLRVLALEEIVKKLHPDPRTTGHSRTLRLSRRREAASAGAARPPAGPDNDRPAAGGRGLPAA